MSHPFRHVAPLLFAGVALGVAGCGVSTSDDAAGAAPGAPVATPSADEATRVQQYLDSLYLRSDVRHSFTSRLGAEIDCVDFDAEPSVRTLRAKGVPEETLHTVPPVPDTLQAFESSTRTSDAFFLGDADDAGRTRACPANTVAHVRVTPERIVAAGGLDAYRSARVHAKTVPPAFNPESGSNACGGTVANLNDYEWALGGWFPGHGSAASGGSTSIAPISAQGATAVLDIAEPGVPADGSHSLQQVWLVSGDCDTAATVEQTLEVGNMVDPGWLGTDAPVLFLAGTADYYQTTGCINGESNISGVACDWGWVPNPSAAITYGAPLTPSVYGGAQHEMKVTYEHLTATREVCTIFGGTKKCFPVTYFTGWGVWVTIDSQSSVYLGQMSNSYYDLGAIGTTGLYDAATEFIAGAEMYANSGVFAKPPAVACGEGLSGCRSPVLKYGDDAYTHDYAYFPTTAYAPTYTGEVLPFVDSEVAGAVIPYWVDTGLAGTPSTWKNDFYYGEMAAHYCL